LKSPDWAPTLQSDEGAREVAPWSPVEPDAAAVTAYRPVVATSAVSVPVRVSFSLLTGWGWAQPVALASSAHSSSLTTWSRAP
jgi:hypothetical protein